MTVKKVDVYKEIDDPNRNFFISASAGTGKTYILTQYFIKVLEKNFPNADIVDNILTVTFTNKAASEMKNRIMEEVSNKLVKKPPYGISKLEWYQYWNEVKINLSRSWIKTIDSFCSRIIRENNISMGVDPNFSIISDFQRDREVERSVYSALRVALEIYQDKEIDWLNFLSTKRKEKIEKYVETLNREKTKFKESFKNILSEIGLDKFEKIIQDIVSNWRIEMSRVLLTNDLELADKELTELYKNFLWLVKIISLIASEFYLGLTIDNFLYDFKAVLEKVAEEFENNPDLLKKYQNKFKYIIVDEFQDTNYLQKEIFDKLHTTDNYFFYVGDRKQSIYRFRGADVSVFSRSLTEAQNSDEEVLLGKLTKNRRSHQQIINFANRLSEFSLFKRDNLQMPDIDPNLLENLSFQEEDISEPEIPPQETETIPTLSEDDTKRVKYIIIEPTDDNGLNNQENRLAIEIETLAKVIKKLLGQEMDFKVRKNNKVYYERRKIEPKDIAVLSKELKNTEKILRTTFFKYNIPFYIFGSKSFYNRPEIQAIFAALNSIQNPLNDYQFVRYMMSLLVGMSFQDLSKLVEKRQGSFFETFENMQSEFPEDVVESYKVLKKYKDLKYYLTPSSILKGIVNDNNYFSKLALTNDPEVSISNIKKLINQAEEYNNMANSFSELVRFLKNASNISEEEASIEDETSNSVKVMTIHKSKGLEFPIVLMIGLHNSISGTKNGSNAEFSIPDATGNRYYILNNVYKESVENSDHWLLKWFKNNEFLDKTESNRLVYVGITRAKDLLIPILVSNEKADTLNNFFLTVKNSDMIDIIQSDHIQQAQENALQPLNQDEKNTLFKEIPQQNLKDLTNLSYKKYIAPTYMIKEIKTEELDLIEDLSGTILSPSTYFDPKNIFSDQELIFRGSFLHSKLRSAQNISHIKNMIKSGELPQGFDELDIVKKAFTPTENKIIKNEWRLMKKLNLGKKEYMLFGIPDKVIIENGDIEILDYKYSELRDPKKINDYKFQILFYLYLLSDFGTPKRGHIISIKTLQDPITFEYDPHFEEQLITLLSKEKVTNEF
ncbi:UvrD-helicase domain-containing protein [Petrotoga sp. DB-2]